MQTDTCPYCGGQSGQMGALSEVRTVRKLREEVNERLLQMPG
jgi:hypothetical protein